MRKRFAAMMLILSIIFCFFLTSCAQKGKQKFTDYSFDYFDTVTTVIGYADSREEFDEVFDFVTSELETYHKLYNIYDSFDTINNLKSVNAAKNSGISVDKKIIDLLEFCKEMHTLTGGKTNVAMGSVLSLWHDCRETAERHPDKATIPDTEKLKSAAEHTDISNVIINEETCTVYLKDSEMSLDVGAVAKGYAVEMIGRALAEKGISGYLLNVGGNIKAIGQKPDGEEWSLGIENPDRENEDTPHVAYLKISDKSLVTSGNYQRYYTVNGKNYHHIIDPETLMPSQYFASVSVLCENSARADALSTALFTMPLNEGIALIESISDAEAMWVENDGKLHYSSGFEDYTFEYKE